MNKFLTLNQISKKTGLDNYRIRYLEARFPKMLQKRLFDVNGRFYR